MRSITIIGGGIAGLAAALRLVDEPDLTVTVIERDERLGGKILTERHGDSFLEGGPDGWIAWRPEGRALCESLGVEVVRSAPGRSSVLRAGRPLPFPEGLVGALPSRLAPALRSPLLSARGKARLIAEPLIRSRRDRSDESAAALVRRRGGRELWERIIEPVVTGMYAADGERLSAEITLAPLVAAEREHGSITRAALAARRRARRDGRGATAPGPPTFLSTTHGMGGIVAAAEARVRERGRIITGHAASALARRDGGWDVQINDESLWSDGVVLAAPAPQAASLLAFDPALATDVAQIPYVDVAVVTMVFPAGAIPTGAGHGYVVPRTEGSPVTACSIASSKFPMLADPNHALVRVFLGRFGAPDVLAADDDRLRSLARASLHETLGVDATPLHDLVTRIPNALPQYVVGHRERQAQIRATIARYPGLELAGAAFGGIGVPDCIASGRAAAERLIGATSDG